MAADPPPFANSLEHILAEMKRVDLMLRRAVLVARRARAAEGPEEFRGLVILDENVDRMLDSVDFLGDVWQMDDAARTSADSIDRELVRRQLEIRRRMEASAQGGQKLTLAHLAAVCGLSPAEVDILLIALAPELEPGYETLYAYLQNDVTRKRPSVDLALNLICRTAQEKLQARELFAADAPLRHFHLIDLHEEQYDRTPTLLRHFIKIDDAVTRFLLERQPEDRTAAALVVPGAGLADLDTSTETRQALRHLVDAIAGAGLDRTVVQMWGRGEAPVFAAAEALAYELRKRVLAVDLARLEADDAAAARIVRDATLWGHLLVLSRDDLDLPEADREKRARVGRALWARLADASVTTVVIGADEQFGTIDARARLWRVQIDAPRYESRRAAWRAALGDTVADLDPERLADAFPFSGARIRQTAALAVARATLRDPASPPVMADVLAAARDLTTPNLQKFAIGIEPRYNWTDLVLPADRMRQLRSVASRLHDRSIVHREWGFGQKLARGRGLSVLFTGATGTGKTMAAEVLANELSLRLFQIDLSTVVSKYIGDTERNLSAIFREAELGLVLLFFDECDALYGKRTEVKDAHDRYANIEVNYLLQRIEQYQGLVVLATNFQKNLDEAFLRRLHYTIDFPQPDEDARERIWRLHFPRVAPRDEDLDFAFLARQFPIAGGHIRNVVVEAAFLAAQEGGRDARISMRHVIEALKHEHQKQGKLVMKSDLGPYSRAS